MKLLPETIQRYRNESPHGYGNHCLWSDVKELIKKQEALLQEHEEAWSELELYMREHSADKSLYVEAGEVLKKMEELKEAKK